MYENHKLGKEGENIAVRYLNKNGYKIILKNFRCRQGEIDIIAKEDDELIFIEVKTRAQLIFGKPVEAVNLTKKNHIKKVAKYYIFINKLYNCKIRFDVIEVYKKEKFYIHHIKNIEV